jgi:hypothetical protein
MARTKSRAGPQVRTCCPTRQGPLMAFVAAHSFPSRLQPSPAKGKKQTAAKSPAKQVSRKSAAPPGKGLKSPFKSPSRGAPTPGTELATQAFLHAHRGMVQGRYTSCFFMLPCSQEASLQAGDSSPQGDSQVPEVNRAAHTQAPIRTLGELLCSGLSDMGKFMLAFQHRSRQWFESSAGISC